jgi:uncharacterized protein with NRDE domain
VCTLILLWKTRPDLPVLVAANRDERLDREATGPALRHDGPLAVLAPRDAVEGGTWLGVNERGVLAGITNRFGRARREGRRSRGLLVLDALAAPTAVEAAERLRSLDPTQANGFHLVIADATSAHLVVGDGEALWSRDLLPGVHVVTERSFDAAPTAREPLLHERLSAMPPLDGQALDALFQPILSVHGASPLEGTCVHAPAVGYGTRSSSLVAVGSGGAVRWLFAGGPPCVTSYEDISMSF